MKRRSYLVTAGASTVALLSGCLGGGDTDPTDGSEQAPTTSAPETTAATTEPQRTTTTDEPERTTTTADADEAVADERSALEVVDDYIAAAAEGDTDALARTMHSAHPFNPENLSEEELETVEYSTREVEEYERELVDTEFGTEDVVAELSDAAMFGEDVSDLVAGERATLVEVRYGSGDGGSETTTQLIMLTENGKWRVFWPYTQRETLPDGQPDGTYDIVESVEYNTETERVRVNLSGVGEITAEELTVYTESAGEGNRTWAPDSDTLPDVKYLTAPFDPTGDVVVVTVTVDGEETVVYRDEYSPE